MILVDTTVWIDFFNNNKNNKVSLFEKLIEENEDICINGVIITEILQGIKNDSDFDNVKEIINDLIYIDTKQENYIYAAQIYRNCRRKGYTIRKPIDCIIASICINNGIFLLHNDKDFDHICKLFPLQCL